MGESSASLVSPQLPSVRVLEKPLMPRGAKVDAAETRIAREQSRAGNGYISQADRDYYKGRGTIPPMFLTDRRSFVTTTGHLRLYGRDMGQLRLRVHKENPHCSECGILTLLLAHMVDPDRAELAHKDSKSARGYRSAGCDCRHNVQIKCRRDHRGPEGEHK